MHFAQIKNTFQHEEDEVEFELLECIRMIKFNNEFLHKQVDDLGSRKNETVSDLHLRWKPLKSNFQKLFLLVSKIFNYF